MASVFVQDSYWFLEGEGEGAVVRAMCVLCAKKARKGWLWEGRLGYGNYDLFCSACGNAIHMRGGNDPEAGNKDEQQ